MRRGGGPIEQEKEGKKQKKITVGNNGCI